MIEWQKKYLILINHLSKKESREKDAAILIVKIFVIRLFCFVNGLTKNTFFIWNLT